MGQDLSEALRGVGTSQPRVSTPSPLGVPPEGGSTDGDSPCGGSIAGRGEAEGGATGEDRAGCSGPPGAVLPQHPGGEQLVCVAPLAALQLEGAPGDAVPSS